MSPSEDDLRRLQRTRRVIYLLVALAILLPYIIHLPPPPFKPAEQVAKLYEKVQSLEAGSHVMMSMDYGPSTQAELSPMARAILAHCFKKGLIPILVHHWPPGVGLAEEILREEAEKAQEKHGRPFVSGTDYVFLGFKPGGAAILILNMGESLKGAFDKDYYGQPTAVMPALQGVNSLKDIQLGVNLASGASTEIWIAYGSDRFGFPLGTGTTAVQAPNMYPFLTSGQLVGLLGGMRGAADYEILLDEPGSATQGMLAQSMAHVLIVVLIVATNVGFVFTRFARKRKD